MCKTALKVIFIFLIAINTSCQSGSDIEKVCCSTLDLISDTIESQFNPDSIICQNYIAQEEIYFPKVRILEILVYNPTTNSVDFKRLNIEKRIDNHVEIRAGLRAEIQYLPGLIKKNLELEKIDKIHIELVKGHLYSKKGWKRYSFQFYVEDI